MYSSTRSSFHLGGASPALSHMDHHSLCGQPASSLIHITLASCDCGCKPWILSTCLDLSWDRVSEGAASGFRGTCRQAQKKHLFLVCTQTVLFLFLLAAPTSLELHVYLAMSRWPGQKTRQMRSCQETYPLGSKDKPRENKAFKPQVFGGGKEQPGAGDMSCASSSYDVVALGSLEALAFCLWCLSILHRPCLYGTQAESQGSEDDVQGHQYYEEEKGGNSPEERMQGWSSKPAFHLCRIVVQP